MHARVLKFHVWIPHKIKLTHIFPPSGLYPFPGPLKKYGLNLVSKVSKKLLKLEP